MTSLWAQEHHKGQETLLWWEHVKDNRLLEGNRTEKHLTPSFLSLSRAPCMNSMDTSSFSSSHCSTNCWNHLEKARHNVNKHQKRFYFWMCLVVEMMKSSLTWGIRAQLPWKLADPSHIHYTAIWPWSAGSCSLRSYTAGVFHVLWNKNMWIWTTNGG